MGVMEVTEDKANTAVVLTATAVIVGTVEGDMGATVVVEGDMQGEERLVALAECLGLRLLPPWPLEKCKCSACFVVSREFLFSFVPYSFIQINCALKKKTRFFFIILPPLP